MPEVSGQSYVSATYLLTSVQDFLESITYRMLADGMILQDIRAAAGSLTDWGQWGNFWIERACAHESLALGVLDKGYLQTAGEHLVRASLCAHYGQFLYFEYPETKRQAAELKARLFRKGAPLISPKAEPIEIPFDRVGLPAYLRLPAGSGPFPAVVLLGGVDAAKEDTYQFSNLCLARGLATLAFDGPGQGEALYRGFLLRPDFHRAVTAVLDELVRRPEIDPNRIGIIGRSLGGFLAPQAAALDKRLRACVAWGALYDLSSFDSKPPLIRDAYRFVTGARDWAEAKQMTAFINLEGIAQRITCPLYVVHGAKDNSVPPINAERLVAEARGPASLWIVPDSIHCNHEVAHIVRPDMADWLARELGSVRAG
jgi:2,6-dihydroxypseudooxynicotine hydrolase